MDLKLPPQNVDAEKSVLGALMLDKNAIIKVADLITAEDFYQPAHLKIFETIIELFEKNEPVDILSVTDKLKDRDELKKIGGASYLAELINSVPTATHVAHYAKLIRNKKVLRDLISASNEITERVFDSPENSEDLLDEIEQKIFSIAQKTTPQNFISLKDELMNAYERIEKLHQGKSGLRGVPTGFSGVDNLLSGLQKSDLIILGARPSLGKTTLALDIARHAASQQFGVAIFSLEMSREQVVDRLISAQARVSLWGLRTGRITDETSFQSIQVALDRLSQMPIFIDDTPSPNVLQIRSMARRLQAENHNLGLIIIDYVQLIQPRTNSENMVQQFTEISHGLKALARELNLPVLAISQLNRAVDAREIKKPRLSDLRETGCLTSDTLIYNPINGAQRTIAELLDKEEKDLQQEYILSINNDHRLIYQPIMKVFSSGQKEIFELTTRSGRKIKASANHPFKKLEGWVNLEELKIKDKIAVARYLPEPLQNLKVDQNKLILLAHLIGDGCYLKRQPLHYTNSDQKCLRIVAQAAKNAFNIDAKWVKQENWWHLYLTHNRKNPLIDWLKELKIYNQRSDEKNFPEFVPQLSNRDLSLFIKNLWATDGTIYFSKSSNNWIINYYSNSRKLLEVLQIALLRFGIIATIKVRKKLGYKDNLYLSIQGAEMQKKFLKEIGIFGEKEILCREALKELELIISNPNLDVIPREVWQIIKNEKDKLDIGWREFSSRLGMQYCGSTLFERAPSRATLTEVAENSPRLAAGMNGHTFQRTGGARSYPSKNTLIRPKGQFLAPWGGVLLMKISERCLENNLVIKNLAESEIYWDEILEIRSLGMDEVYDISVKEPHNFLANGIFVHNSWEQDADVVMFIYRRDKDKLNPSLEETNTGEIIIEKHRNGPTGVVEVKFDNEKVSFAQIDKLH